MPLRVYEKLVFDYSGNSDTKLSTTMQVSPKFRACLGVGTEMKRAVVSVLVLSAVWLLGSGHYTVQMMSFGAASCVFVVFLLWRMDILDSEGEPTQLGIRPFLFLPWLFKQIALSNIDVARRVLDPNMPISPELFEIEAHQRTDTVRVYYANAITLTPGTISIRLRDDKILIHALTQEAADDVREGEMDRRLCVVEGATS